MPTMRTACHAPAIALAVGLFLVGVAHGAEWGTLVPGQSTIESVRAAYGEPTRRNSVKVEGYDTIEWVYEGERAPRGVRRLSVEFGLLMEGGYRPELVRLFRLEPMPGIFTQRAVLLGWGPPTRVGKDGETPVFFYQDGLIVLFDKQGWIAERMIFTPPQPAQRE